MYINETIPKHSKTMQNTVNTSTHITKTPTQLSKHPHIHTPTHYKTRWNSHSTRYTPNEIVTIQSNTLGQKSP